MPVSIEVKVVPSSGKQECFWDKSGKLKCFLKSPAEKGKANNELLKLLAKYLEISALNLKIISGATARKKLVKIDCEISREKIELAFESQKKDDKESQCQIFTGKV